jgi:RNA polymerase sigma-70 factor, ECF subfamily
VSELATVSAADVAEFEAVRPRLFGIAYRIVGGAAEAEDVVQDTWVRWHGTDRRAVRNAGAFLGTAATRLAINVVDSARVRHETSTGAWMPEPSDPAADPSAAVERDEAFGSAVRTLLEKLSATERAAYVLREAFDYPYRQIADVLELSEANARQLVTRARSRLGGERRLPVNAGEHERLLTALTTASETGDLTQLEQVLRTHHRKAHHEVAGHRRPAFAAHRRRRRDLFRPARASGLRASPA